MVLDFAGGATLKVLAGDSTLKYYFRAEYKVIIWKYVIARVPRVVIIFISDTASSGDPDRRQVE